MELQANPPRAGGCSSLVGLLSIVAGVIILFKPSDSLSTLAVIAGIFLLVDGILELIDSVHAGTRPTVASSPSSESSARSPASF